MPRGVQVLCLRDILFDILVIEGKAEPRSLMTARIHKYKLAIVRRRRNWDAVWAILFWPAGSR